MPSPTEITQHINSKYLRFSCFTPPGHDILVIIENTAVIPASFAAKYAPYPEDQQLTVSYDTTESPTVYEVKAKTAVETHQWHQLTTLEELDTILKRHHRATDEYLTKRIFTPALDDNTYEEFITQHERWYYFYTALNEWETHNTGENPFPSVSNAELRFNNAAEYRRQIRDQLKEPYYSTTVQCPHCTHFSKHLHKQTSYFLQDPPTHTQMQAHVYCPLCLTKHIPTSHINTPREL